MSVKKNQRKRLNLQVKRNLQVWLMIRIGGIIILTSIISALILYSYAHHETINSFYDAHIKLRRLSDLLIPVVLSGSFVSLIGGALVAIFLPQKLAGPLFRVEKDFKSVEQGDLTVRIHLRNNDSLQSFADRLNSTINHLDQQMGQIQQLSTTLKDQSNADNPEMIKTLERLDLLISPIKTTYAAGKKGE
jgi:methyl-accepting chemotaxis protein